MKMLINFTDDDNIVSRDMAGEVGGNSRCFETSETSTISDIMTVWSSSRQCFLQYEELKIAILTAHLVKMSCCCSHLILSTTE